MRIYLFSLLLLAHNSLLAQTDVEAAPKPLGTNIAYLELGGISYLYSLNYQRNIPLSKKLDVGVGVSLSPLYRPATLFPAPPGANVSRFSPRASVLAQAIYKIDRHEIGIGASWGCYTWYYPDGDPNGLQYQMIRSYSNGQLGYSYTLNNGVYVGAYYTPSVMDAGDFDFHHWTGFRIGYRF